MERILVVKLAGIGDVLTATPALRALRRGFPSAHLAALVPPASVAVLAGSPLVDEVIPFDKFLYDSPVAALRPHSLAEALGFLRWLHRQRYTRVVIMHHLITRWGALKYAALALATGAERRLGLDDGRGWFLTERIPDRGYGSRHEVECCLALAAAWGAATDDIRLEIALSAEGERVAESVLPAQGRGPLVAVHPGTGWYAPARRWPAERFARVADGLAKAWGSRVVLVGGPEESGLAEEVLREMRTPALNLVGRVTLKQLAAVLRRCALLVSNDSGVMHLATAVGTPVVAIFGPSNPVAWRPWDGAGGARSRVVRVELPCSPCLYVGRSVGPRRGCATMGCLEAVTPEMVLVAAADFLARDSGCDHG